MGVVGFGLGGWEDGMRLAGFFGFLGTGTPDTVEPRVPEREHVEEHTDCLTEEGDECSGGHGIQASDLAVDHTSEQTTDQGDVADQRRTHHVLHLLTEGGALLLRGRKRLHLLALNNDLSLFDDAGQLLLRDEDLLLVLHLRHHLGVFVIQLLELTLLFLGQQRTEEAGDRTEDGRGE